MTTQPRHSGASDDDPLSREQLAAQLQSINREMDDLMSQLGPLEDQLMDRQEECQRIRKLLGTWDEWAAS